MGIDDRAAERQAEPRARLLGVETHAELEDAGKLLTRDTRAGIGDCDVDAVRETRSAERSQDDLRPRA